MLEMTLDCTTGSNAPTQSTTSLECENQTQDYISALQIVSLKYKMASFMAHINDGTI